MYTASFKSETTIRDQKDLRSVFHSDDVYLRRDACLVVTGQISLDPNVIFSGQNRLCGPIIIEAGSVLTNVELGSGCVVRNHSVLSDVYAGSNNLFGPFCFVRNNCTVADNVILGAHVETTRSRFACDVKVSHRAFIGDAQIGAETIVGAGTVVCNHDGVKHQSTVIGDRVLIGSGSMLVAPVAVSDDVLIGAGSVVTTNLPTGTKLVQKRRSR